MSASNGTLAPAVAATRQPRTRGLLITSLVLLAVVGAQAVAVTSAPNSPWTQGVDDAWRSAVGVGHDSGAYTWALPMFFQQLGQLPGVVALFLLLPIALFIVGRWRSALFVMAVQFAAPGLVSQLLKNTVNRPRPAADEAAGLFGPLFTVDHGSFPSGHAVSAGALAVILVALKPAATKVARISVLVIGALLTLGMIWQRTLINAHWLSDTIAGVFAGVGVAMLLWWAFEPWLRRDRWRRPWFLKTRTESTKVSKEQA